MRGPLRPLLPLVAKVVKRKQNEGTHMARPDGPNLDRLAILDEEGHRKKVHPADVDGMLLHWRRRVFYFLIGLFLVGPWLRVGGEPVIKLDIPRRSFHLFGLVFNAQDGFLLFFVLTGVGFSLIVISALFGRLWCGWSCPQTVFLEGIYRRIERLIEGPSNARLALDQAPWNRGKVAKRAAKWTVYVLVSLVLAHTFVAYFVGARELVSYLTLGPAAHPGVFGVTMFFTAGFLFDMGWFREQFCLILCPYGRLQSVLTDEDTFVIGYDKTRGEPRGAVSQKGAGDCVDCRRCVQVCPTGIDIRNGLQLDCIGCGQCADACDAVMLKIGRNKGLVRTDSLKGLRGEKRRFLRPRLIGYAVAATVGATVATAAIANRVSFEANVLRVPGAPYVIANGIVTNPMMLHLVNKTGDPMPMSITIEAPAGVTATLPGAVELGPEESRSLPVVFVAAQGSFSPGVGVVLVVSAHDEEKRVKAKLMGPTTVAPSLTPSLTPPAPSTPAATAPAPPTPTLPAP